MSDGTKLVPQLAELTYIHTLVIESTHEYKVHGPYGSNFPCTIGTSLNNNNIFPFTENPCPQQGDIVNIRLSENMESVQQPDGTYSPMMVDMFFQMNYASGQWKRIKKLRPVVDEEEDWWVVFCHSSQFVKRKRKILLFTHPYMICTVLIESILKLHKILMEWGYFYTHVYNIFINVILIERGSVSFGSTM